MSRTQHVTTDAAVLEAQGDAACAKRSNPEFADLIGRSGPMLEVLRTVERVSGTDLPVMIVGESGTGKDVIARAIHMASHRAAYPFLAVSCGALTETLLQAELFGHSANAFAGATVSRQGALADAQGGTLLLDEISDLSPALQASLVQVIQSNEIRPSGSPIGIRLDVRIIATTSRDPDVLVASGLLREDLLRVLSVISLRLPPLRERGRDIDSMISAFIARYRRPGSTPVRVASDAQERLRSYAWPGNVRELRQTMQRLASTVNGPTIRLSDLPERIRSTHGELDVLIHEMPSQDVVGKAWPVEAAGGEGSDGPADPDRTWLPLVELERRYLVRTLYYTRGNKKRAAAILGVDRKTLSRMVERHTINVMRIKRDVRGLR